MTLTQLVFALFVIGVAVTTLCREPPKIMDRFPMEQLR